MALLDSRLTRRDWFRLTSAGALGCSLSGWLELLAAETAGQTNRTRSCILLWMSGGPSQMDTFDLKPGHENGGPYKAIDTTVPGMKISEHLPLLAKQAKHLSIIRSMKTREGDHSRATYHMRTGYLPQGPITYPTIGSLVSKEIGSDNAELPNFVSIAPYRVLNPAAYGPGFLGSKFAPLVVGERAPANQQAGYDFSVEDLQPPNGIANAKMDLRLELKQYLESGFVSKRADAAITSHRVAYQRAVRLMRSEAAKAFELDEEPQEIRDAYGNNAFGQGCLLARRLVERRVPFVEVALTGAAGNQTLGWDTHVDNFENVRQLSNVLDPGFATLVKDLDNRGLLDTTLIVWMGEFGRTPKINDNTGRDHFPQAWSTVLAGGGIKKGQVVGKTSDDGTEVVDRPVAVPDFLATVCQALGVDPSTQNNSNVGRPISIVDLSANPVEELLT